MKLKSKMKEKAIYNSPKIILPILLLFTIACNRPEAVPASKKEFIGTWTNSVGFRAEIRADGTTDLTMTENSKHPDNVRLYIGVAPQYAKNMLARFRGDSILLIIQPHVAGKAYKIERLPWLDGDTMKVVLNGVVLRKER